MDSELKFILTSLGLMLFTIIVINAVFLWKCKPYREFMEASFYVCNPDMAIKRVMEYLPQATQEEINGISQMVVHKVEPAVMALCLDNHLKVKRDWEDKRG